MNQEKQIMNRIGLKNIKLTEYELSIAAHLVDPTTISVSWTDIAGLEGVIQELQETVILPFKRRELFLGSALIKPPKGVLLHGPPGCGKTMIAKATAREAGARFINIEPSALMDKMEPDKLAAAVFSLAVKVQPSIIFIDEIDSFLRSRNSHDESAVMKLVFMILWDGLITDSNCQVIVMGATNRPQDVDRAILRRMPSMFHVGLPSVQQRKSILNLILTDEMVSDDVDFNRLAKLTEGSSGSDLRELCRNAAIDRILGLETARDTDDEDTFHDALNSSNKYARFHQRIF